MKNFTVYWLLLLLMNLAVGDSKPGEPTYYRFVAERSFPDAIGLVQRLRTPGADNPVAEYLRNRLPGELRQRIANYRPGGNRQTELPKIIAGLATEMNKLFDEQLEVFYRDAGISRIRLRPLTQEWTRPYLFSLFAEHAAPLNASNLSADLKLLFSAETGYQLTPGAKIIVKQPDREWEIKDDGLNITWIIVRHEQLEMTWSQGKAPKKRTLPGKYRAALNSATVSEELRRGIAELNELTQVRVVTRDRHWQLAAGKRKFDVLYRPIEVHLDLIRTTNNNIAKKMKYDYRRKRLIRMYLEDAFPELSRLDRLEFVLARQADLHYNIKPSQEIAEDPEYEPASFLRTRGAISANLLTKLAQKVAELQHYSDHLRDIYDELLLSSDQIRQSEEKLQLFPTDQEEKVECGNWKTRLKKLVSKFTQEVRDCRNLKNKHWNITITINYTVCDYDFWTANDLDSGSDPIEQSIKLFDSYRQSWDHQVDETRLQLVDMELLLQKERVVKIKGKLELLVNGKCVADRTFTETLSSGAKGGEIKCYHDGYWGSVCFTVKID